ncbi:Methyltransferase domain-containing protein [Arenibacter nanhaiticus]|uniref:Methyltransferase domain-containing protein n=1 Tax=Arenibacter nanhaiticus TaxID=558155 RepID=A0A1M6LGY6_9FLAO|nr:class I SAM-dependent methyltransferase [Arenibacter nanhaiticus]SHJ70473.1 Methyltransferase domain-containing protein [Arenibacter nanhaiticus]
MEKDIFGKAIADYHAGNYSEDIKTYSSLEEEDTIPLPYLFRDYKKMPVVEQKALKLCKGTVLDIGCGAGSHSLYLQKNGLQVTALDHSKGAIETCIKRGITQTVCSDIYDFKDQKFDTLLMLMNGIGIVGKLQNIDALFTHLKTLLKPNGQLLLDSSDIIYMFEEDEDGGYWIPDNTKYYGEVDFVMEYKGEKSDSLPWLYIDYNTLQRAANANNLNCELVYEGEHYDYLAKLTLIKE